jgi:hypothetical protein
MTLEVLSFVRFIFKFRVSYLGPKLAKPNSISFQPTLVLRIERMTSDRGVPVSIPERVKLFLTFFIFFLNRDNDLDIKKLIML